MMIESFSIESVPLERNVKFDFYIPAQTTDLSACTLLIANDGQDLVAMNFSSILSPLQERGRLKPLICVGVHCGDDRRNEYGMIASADYKGRGSKGALYEQFILRELFPFIHAHFEISRFENYAYTGFSLGGLNAMDLAWNHPEIFSKVGVFSGSFWWRSKDQDAPDYNENKHRLMHRQIAAGGFHPGMKFFFECGELDETSDRNKNGVIDSIDDTLDLIRILVNKGYRESIDICYLQLPDGRHDVPTWAKAFPEFLTWGWGV